MAGIISLEGEEHMCRVGQVHVSRVQARPCWPTLSPHSMLASGVDQIWMTCGKSTNSKSREMTCFLCLGCRQPSLSEEQSRRGPLVMVRMSYESKERSWYILGIVLQIWKATFSSQKIVEMCHSYGNEGHHVTGKLLSSFLSLVFVQCVVRFHCNPPSFEGHLCDACLAQGQPVRSHLM